MRLILEEKTTVHVECEKEEVVPIVQAVVRILRHEVVPRLPKPEAECVYIVQQEPRMLRSY